MSDAENKPLGPPEEEPKLDDIAGLASDEDDEDADEDLDEEDEA